jgi:hypothetical protein
MFRENRIGSIGAFLGVVLLFIGTYLHPMQSDPNVPVAAFAEYASDPHWRISHLMQLGGVVCIVVALLLFARNLQSNESAWLAQIAGGSAIASAALAAALQAVDGIALKSMVDAWAATPAIQQDGLFHAAFAVRQIEIGLASMFCLAMGFTAAAFALALLSDRTYPAWFAYLALIGGIPTGVAGVVIAYTGFSPLSMAINMPANLVLLIWMLILGMFMWRQDKVKNQLCSNL